MADERNRISRRRFSRGAASSMGAFVAAHAAWAQEPQGTPPSAAQVTSAEDGVVQFSDSYGFAVELKTVSSREAA